MSIEELPPHYTLQLQQLYSHRVHQILMCNSNILTHILILIQKIFKIDLFDLYDMSGFTCCQTKIMWSQQFLPE